MWGRGVCLAADASEGRGFALPEAVLQVVVNCPNVSTENRTLVLCQRAKAHNCGASGSLNAF